ncbi:MAG: hypothetical protein IJJ65_09045 [Butyrivibrio sp.]|nr:hypothetical protein [Butyrivibrio sp.]
MVGFKTNNSIYLVNQEKKQISGGVFNGDIYNFDNATIIVGLPAEIKLSDGRYVRTSTVNQYL